MQKGLLSIFISTIISLSLLNCAGSNSSNNTNNTNNTTNTNNCSNPCSTSGNARCSEDNIIQVCGLKDGCLQWVDNTDCTLSEDLCRYNSETGDPECASTCSNNCETNGEARCSENKLEICEPDQNQCLNWSVSENCSDANQICDDSGTEPQCLAECNHGCNTSGETRCNNDAIEICQEDQQGCFDWEIQQDCTTNEQICLINQETSDPECVYDCSDNCSQTGDTKCQGNIVQTCELQTNNCLDWSDTQNCSTNSQICDDTGTEAQCESGDLNIYITEYMEGSSYNKAIEIFFAAVPGTYDTSNCSILIYNSGTTPNYTIPLLAYTVSTGDFHVICHDDIALNMAPSCNQLSSTLSFNGNDTIELVCDSTTRDVIGQIGNYTDIWGVDVTLRRKSTVISGDTNGLDTFDPTIEWDEFPADSFTDLGQ
ncbi:MAG: hypothetical protein PF689_12900 [Deltaproteobacteria bacterium]|jgi:hypothetical protein|nr:hypothetical protein [Deltaproteobacteria bacterium]